MTDEKDPIQPALDLLADLKRANVSAIGYVVLGPNGSVQTGLNYRPGTGLMFLGALKVNTAILESAIMTALTQRPGGHSGNQ